MPSFITDQSLLVPLLILLLGGVSLSVGQSAVLLANRVRPGRFILSLIGGGFIFAIGAIVWVISIHISANFVLGIDAPIRTTLTLLAWSYTPFLLGFLIFLPYLGNIWNAILRIWVFITLIILFGATFDLTFLSSLLICGFGWIILELLFRLPLFDLSIWQERLLRRTTGKEELYSISDLADKLAEEIRSESQETDSSEHLL